VCDDDRRFQKDRLDWIVARHNSDLWFRVRSKRKPGEIKGTVTDNSGAVVPGVKVTITNLQTGITTVTTSNSAGIYDAPSVPTGAGFPDG
jgi:hypothetical protein